jgi:F-type H+-transporting ATPase subunit gamma
LATLKEIKVRIGAVKNTQKITKAMRMVAAAKLRRAQDRMTSARPYARKINELLTHLVSASETVQNPLMERREGATLVIVVTSDRGLCGSFNTNLLKVAFNHIKRLGAGAKVVCVGKKGFDFFKSRKVDLYDKYIGVFNNLNVEASNEIVNRIVDGYMKREYGKVEIIYNEFKSVVKQEIRIEQFLPIVSKDTDGKKAKNLYYIYEPDMESILNNLIPRQLKVQLWKALLESNASEQGARMTAMETASRNASDLIKFLEIQYNRARQEAITKEILEIVGGAEALKEA